jgi:CRISPR-associated protein Csd1
VFEKYPGDTEIEAVYRFLVNGNYRYVFSDPNWQECLKIQGCNLSFRLEDQLNLICENENVRAYIVATNDTKSGGEDDDVITETLGTCLITGKYGLIERLHPRTPIFGSKSNAKIVSFQKNSGFDSYGKEQGFNAPMSKTAVFGYSTALNRMLSRGSSQYIQVGDASTVFWAARKNPLEDMFADFFGEKAKENYTQDNESIKALYKAPEKGTPPLQEDLTPFYVLGLSPNASRIAVRFWYAGTAGQVAKNIRQHFDDISIVHKKRTRASFVIPVACFYSYSNRFKKYPA